MPVHQQAQQIAHHVAYEVELFFRSVERFEQSSGQDVISDNQCLEDALTHARVIYEFLFRPPRRNCPDVRARHFFDTPSQWTLSSGDLCPYMMKHLERLNRSVLHLSYDRLQYEPNKKWDLHTITNEIKDSWKFFLEKLPPERRQWFAPSGAPQTGPYSPQTNLCAKTESIIADQRAIRPI